MPLQATSGAASYDAFGGGVPSEPNYIESVFSTYLYTGNDSTQTITNGIDLAGKGGLVWTKCRSFARNNGLTDTATGASKYLSSDQTSAQGSYSGVINAFSSSGYTTGSDTWYNEADRNYVSWTFRKQPKFFDVLTWTGNGASNRSISHALGSTPGFFVVKPTSTSGSWFVYHRSAGSNGAYPNYLILNGTDSAYTGDPTVWSSAPTSSVINIGSDGSVNNSGTTYVAYLFAHDAGGFGLTGTDNVISCGSYTGNGSASGPTITLGYEPQWVLVKRTDSTSNWTLSDNMRGQPVDGATAILYPNASDAEASATTAVSPTATGFQVKTSGATYNASGGTYIYIAIRRGPMKVPTSGTSVYAGETYSGNATARSFTAAGFPPDLFVADTRSGTGDGAIWGDRLRGANRDLYSAYTSAEGTNTQVITNFGQNGASIGTDSSINGSGKTYIGWNFRRAPSFFDEVCYTGNGAGSNAKTHNLTVAPELLIIKNRSSSGSGDWYTFHTFTSSNFKKQLLDTTDAQTNYSYGSFLDAQPSSTTFTVNSGAGCNESGTTYVAYLFATCAGVSKVTTFTGNGSSQTINCGFTGGARFVLIKRVDSTGNWVTFDTARGISSGNDPALYLNSTAAEVTGVDAIDPDSTGFIVNQESTFNLNVSSATYLVLAIA